MMNAYINFKINSKKLKFGEAKFQKLHIGHTKEQFKCQDLAVDKWKEVEVHDDETGDIKLVDIFDEEKDLGDVVSVDGKNIKNIKSRIAKGKGIVDKI